MLVAAGKGEEGVLCGGLLPGTGTRPEALFGLMGRGKLTMAMLMLMGEEGEVGEEGWPGKLGLVVRGRKKALALLHQNTGARILVFVTRELPSTKRNVQYISATYFEEQKEPFAEREVPATNVKLGEGFRGWGG